MKPLFRLFAATLCCLWAAFPLVADEPVTESETSPRIETVTVAGIFECTYYGAGAGYTTETYTQDGEQKERQYSSQLDWTAEQKAVVDRVLTAWTGVLHNTPGRTMSVALLWGDYGEGSLTLGSASSSMHAWTVDGYDKAYLVTSAVEAVWHYGYEKNDLGTYDLVINLNCEYADDFYYGLETDRTIFQYDFQSVVMHEVGHAVGFMSAAQPDGTYLTLSAKDGSDTRPALTNLDILMLDAEGYPLVDKAVESLTETQVSPVFVPGDTIKLEGSELLVYNPNPWEEGSSMSHVTGDEDALMQHDLDYNVFRREVTAGEVQLLAQMGWKVIPEPATATLSLLALAALAACRRRR